MAEISLTVVTDPVAKARARVAMRRGRIHAYTPAKTQNAEWRIRTAFVEKFPTHKPFTGPIEIDVGAWLRMPASIPKGRRASALPARRPDLDNYLKTVLDALNGVAFLDDSQVVTARVAKAYAWPDEAPSWAITIRDLAPNAPAHVTPGVPAHEPESSRLRRTLG